MPLTRYQIRNEYSLADPEIYRAPDKNDPEALLQGVAMAGLVGLLRQLGDLSEFAADLFHNLHEEVMATAGRSHGLMNRLQQVEADIPSVEKAFLSHTSDKKLLYNAGIDWHPNLRMDQNMITRGDLPRFVMDSYEECRGPPRLFLLDKFDIAGAGACSKRYSDPSFFKTDFTSFEKTKTASHREKKARKIKRRASLCRNGEASEIVPTTNSKLHQLFLEENNQTENIVPIHHVKLKRRQSNCSVLDPTTEKSYMQRFLGTSSPESKAVYENAASPLLLTMESGNSRELVPEIHEICIRSPDRKLGAIDRTPAQSPSKQDKVLEQSFDELIPDFELKSNPSTLYKVEDQKEFFGRDSKTEPSTDGYLSDDVTSEMDNFVDALTTMESEMETDVVNRLKYERGLNIEEKGEDFDTNEKQHKLQVQFSDTHSFGSAIAYDDGNVEVQNVISSSGKKQEYLTSVKNHPESNDFAEHKNLKIIDEVPPAELGSASSGFACSEVETSYNNLDGFSNTTVCDIQEGPALDWVHFDSVDTNEKSDIPLDFPSKYVVTVIREPSSVIEVHSQLADLASGTSDAKTDEEDSILDHNPIRSPSEDHINSGKCHGNGDSGEDKLGITEITAQRHLNGPDAKNEPVVGCSNFNELCDTQSDKPSISKLLNNVNDPPLVECSHDCSNLSDDFNYPSSLRKSDLQLASKDPPQSHLSDISEVTKSSASHSPPELEASLEQGLEIKADVLNAWSLHEDEDIEESSNHIDCDDHDEPSVSSYLDPLCQPSEPKFSLLPTSHKPERSKVSEAIHEQPLDSAPSTAALDFSQPEHSALQANMEETTALPPLTPKQWKEGTLQDVSQTSEGEGVRPSFNLYSQLSPPATDQKDQHGFPTLEGKLAHPLSEPNTDDEKPHQGPQIFDGKLVQPCMDPLPSLPATKSEKIQQDTQTLDRKVAQPLDPILSLTVMEQEKPQHGSLTSGIESLHPGMNPFQHGEHTSLTSEGVLQQPWNSFAPPVREDEKSQNISSALKGQLVQPLDSFTGSTTTEDGKPEHGDLYTNGGMTWQWHSSPVAPDVEDGKPNEVLTKRIPRPRNPLAEEFVSRDKIMLRKVEERVLPQLRPNVVGRDSLLEQIRTKSFNLKPAVATRPSIKGPNTNLKVVAILEKANAIRQALAGSDDDDDDDDSWSDS